MPEAKAKGRINLQMVLILLGTICFFATNHIMTVSIPLLISDTGLDLSIIGYCTAAMGAMTILTKFITPKLTNSFGIRKLVTIDLWCLVLVSLLFCFASKAGSIILLRTLFGVPFSIFPIVNLIVITLISSDKEQLLRNTSLIGMAMPISMMISPLVTEWLIGSFSYKTVFFSAFFASLFCFLIYGFAIRCESKLSRKEQSKEVRHSLFDALRLFGKNKLRSIGFPILAFFFLGVVDMLMLTYFPLLATNQNKPYGFYFTLFSIAMVLSQFSYSHIKTPAKINLAIGYGLLAVSILAATFSDISFYLLVIISAISLGIGYSLTETATNTIVMQEKESAEISITVQQLSICIGRTAGPWFIALFSSSIDRLRSCFVMIAIAMAIPFMLSMISSKRKSI